MGVLTYGPGKFFWSQDECFCIYGDGYNESTTFLRSGRGYGMNGLNSAYVKDGVLYWPSKYKGGELLALTFGSSGPAGAVLEKVVTEKNVRIAIFSTGEKISDVFQAMPKMDSRLHTVAWDTRQDWENIPAAHRPNLVYRRQPRKYTNKLC